MNEDAGGRSRGRAIFWGWILCGVLDITSAIIISIRANGSPVRMLQGIAGAVLGPKTFEYGPATAVMGLVMHFCVALTATVLFYWVSRRIPVLAQLWVLGGIVWGIVWLFVMYRGVIPLMRELRPLYLANAPRRPLPDVWPVPFFVHIVCVGLPIAFAAWRFGPRPVRAESAG